MDNNLGEKWIIEDMKIIITPDQILKAILSISDISLGKAECYIESVKINKDGKWEIDVRGAE